MRVLLVSDGCSGSRRSVMAQRSPHMRRPRTGLGAAAPARLPGGRPHPSSYAPRRSASARRTHDRLLRTRYPRRPAASRPTRQKLLLAHDDNDAAGRHQRSRERLRQRVRAQHKSVSGRQRPRPRTLERIAMSHVQSVTDTGRAAASARGSGRHFGVALVVIATAQLVVVLVSSAQQSRTQGWETNS